MRVLVCVGSTKFPELVNLVMSTDVIKSLKKHGCSSMLIQAGELPDQPLDETYELKIEICTYITNLVEEIKGSDLLICHGGVGCIIEALKYRKRVIAIPNPLLVDNHQLTFIKRMEEHSYITKSSLDVKDLLGAIEVALSASYSTWILNNGEKFASIINGELHGLS